MKGSNWVSLITALLTFLAVAWQGYSEYLRTQPAVPYKQSAEFPIYWNDGQHWYCKVGDQIYIWRPNTEGIACSMRSCKK